VLSYLDFCSWPKLTAKHPRVDVEIYNESCALFASNAKVRKVFKEADNGSAATSQAVERRKLIAVELDQDDGFIVRVVLGKLSSRESSEWIGRASRKLDLSGGKLVVAAGTAYVSEGLDDECYSIVKVPKGEYLVTVYQQLSSVNGFRITHLPDWPGFLPYFRTTRSTSGKPPEWLVNCAECQGGKAGRRMRRVRRRDGCLRHPTAPGLNSCSGISSRGQWLSLNRVAYSRQMPAGDYSC
jgi:hypothetical protein